MMRPPATPTAVNRSGVTHGGMAAASVLSVCRSQAASHPLLVRCAVAPGISSSRPDPRAVLRASLGYVNCPNHPTATSARIEQRSPTGKMVLAILFAQLAVDVEYIDPVGIQ